MSVERTCYTVTYRDGSGATRYGVVWIDDTVTDLAAEARRQITANLLPVSEIVSEEVAW